MTNYSELKRLAEAIESCTSLPEKDEAAWMRRTTGRAVIELLEELESFKAEIPQWTEREITLIADKQRFEAALLEMTRFRDNAASHMLRIRGEATDFQKERDNLKTENEALRRDKSEPCDSCFMADAEALRKDADRYRWLRQYKFAVPNAAELDNSIDSFMSKGGRP